MVVWRGMLSSLGKEYMLLKVNNLGKECVLVKARNACWFRLAVQVNPLQSGQSG